MREKNLFFSYNFYWFNPVAWAAGWQMYQDLDRCCDELFISQNYFHVSAICHSIAINAIFDVYFYCCHNVESTELWINFKSINFLLLPFPSVRFIDKLQLFLLLSNAIRITFNTKTGNLLQVFFLFSFLSNAIIHNLSSPLCTLHNAYCAINRWTPLKLWLLRTRFTLRVCAAHTQTLYIGSKSFNESTADEYSLPIEHKKKITLSK